MEPVICCGIAKEDGLSMKEVREAYNCPFECNQCPFLIVSGLWDDDIRYTRRRKKVAL